MASTTPQAGGRITAALLAGIAPLAVIKGAGENVTSSTTLQNDDALLLSVVANATYLFFCWLDYEGGTQGSSDIKWTWSVPSGAAIRYGGFYIGTTGTLHGSSVITEATTVSAGTNGAGNLTSAFMPGSLQTSSTAGTVQLQWAQNTSSGTATTVHGLSFLALWRIS